MLLQKVWITSDILVTNPPGFFLPLPSKAMGQQVPPKLHGLHVSLFYCVLQIHLGSLEFFLMHNSTIIPGIRDKVLTRRNYAMLVVSFYYYAFLFSFYHCKCNRVIFTDTFTVRLYPGIWRHCRTKVSCPCHRISFPWSRSLLSKCLCPQSKYRQFLHQLHPVL